MPDFVPLRQRLQTVTPADTARWGIMSAAQSLCHIRDAFAIPLGTMAAATVPCPIPRPLMKFLALRMPMKWPQSVETHPLLKLGTAPAPLDFAHDLATTLAALDRFTAATPIDLPHPIFGPMNTADWQRWGWLHVDHHLRQFGR